MATSDGAVKVVEVGPREALALRLAGIGAAEAGQAARMGGYQLTPELAAKLSTVVAAAVLAGVNGLDEEEVLTADRAALEEAARELGLRAMVAVLGPPPAAH